MTREALDCQRDGLKIKGKITYPDSFDSEKAYPCAVFSHGFTGNYTDMLRWSDLFAKMGYVSACFSFCGGGKDSDTEEIRSQGSSKDMTISTEVADLSAVLHHMLSLPYVDKTRMILLGESQGGYVSGLTAARYPDFVSRLIMIYPALCIPDHARRGLLGGAVYDPANVPEVLDCHVTKLGRKIHEDVVGRDTFLELAPYKGPVLLIQGLADPIVNPAYATRAAAEYGADQCHLIKARDLGHGLDDTWFETVSGHARMFLQDKKEILAIRVVLTKIEEFGDEVPSTYQAEAEGTQGVDLYFTGYCDTPYFQGAVMSGACDHRVKRPDGSEDVRAIYTLEGVDGDGTYCQSHVVNTMGERDWSPRVTTDSKCLSWLNDAKLTAILEYSQGGPTVRIYG